MPKLQTFGALPGERKVIAQSIDYDDGTHEISHVHHRLQLVYATTGIVRTMTPLGLWTLTPDHALLIGSQIEHELHMVGKVSMRTLYIDPAALPVNGVECRLLPVDALLRASILGMFDPALDEGEEESGAGTTRETLLVPLILRLLKLACAHAPDKRLPLPAHPRLRRICERLIAQPASNDTLDDWADEVGASARTVARLFRQETGMTFGQWREQLRLAEAMSKLEVGHSLVRIAQELGYADVRTFSAMFRRTFGCTPQQFQKRGTGEG
ncbi:helix-turn-helix transcriptional regulator [Paraburkholderia caballeronis]|uniref:AraC-type DNA-binding protein n=1 Tax=Paraburkholderia caballeronis TaxID=416943 RepID=A0A1H7M070_9BURK|nr:helix-turn-helix transcriptional regulator [Paraburkholderia caballeronis]PXW28672.1 AraC family transcriptional regulator [Paraburkholderia caballeronis]PXX04038.1 AraC family transcriptional regulator [Paraburkholderia caballeronis]RAK04782.1 AraC family transcriptional regulator [Paraburkholderia caballeronis]SED65239.1 transcriptional regulator, AraC family [Paraburkholderia caballeronis]SEL04623.1 AraC-type DNA-binding protein [Paraburkholderia caballeronis]